jgi:riboflavin kinase / FMN adenylyltransferase
MNTIHLDTSTPALPPCVATIGFFDGVHLGHQHLISQVRAEAQRLGLASAVVTFATHPRQVVNADYVPQLLTSLQQKLELLAQTGVDEAVVLPFDRHMASLSAHDFMQQLLKVQINAHTLITGYDNRFGHNRAEGFADYVRYGETMGMQVLQGKALTLHDVNVSSSAVRRMLCEGRAADAARFLGRCYTIEGRVEQGFHEGRRMGFPTANIAPTLPEQLIPQSGVYAAHLQIAQGPWLPAMINVGSCPTFGRNRSTIEAHIIGFEGDIYGSTVTAAFVGRLRDERRFDSAEALKTQLAVDRQQALNLLAETENK